VTKPSRSRLKRRLLRLLQAGTGSLVLATTALVAPTPATAAPSSDSLLRRVEEARTSLIKSLPEGMGAGDKRLELAFWGNIGRPRWPNWRNGWANWPAWGNIARPPWPNWPNLWNNWPNWPNWRNF